MVEVAALDSSATLTQLDFLLCRDRVFSIILCSLSHQRDNSGLKGENNEYKLRLQAMEQQSQLKDALNETLDAEVRRLRRAVSELGRESLTSCMDRQLAINQQMFQLQHQQPSQHKHFLLQNHHNQEEIQSWSQQIQGNELHPQAQIQ
ncbi:Transcription factor RF2b [Glycine soja]|uniref:Transcription factor RF2b n=1 Tax=Glycine soja TaxID=3848 RepID=A0A0B2PIW1_GLYSO|nr:Transcription factor RF2b [Glycine soja]